MKTLVIVLCSLAMPLAAATHIFHDAARQPRMLHAPLLSDASSLEDLIATADALRQDEDTSWQSHQEANGHLNWRKLYDEAPLTDKGAVALIRYELAVEAPTIWLLRVRGNCGFRAYLDGEQIAEHAYQRGIHQIAELPLSGSHRLELLVSKPKAEERWNSEVHFGRQLLSVQYDRADAADLQLVLPAAHANASVALHTAAAELGQLPAMEASTTAAHFRGLVRYVPEPEDYTACQLVVDGEQYSTIDLAAVRRLRDFEAVTEAGIRSHRTGTLRIEAEPGALVRVRQLRHAFAFGTAIAWSMFINDEHTFLEKQAEHNIFPDQDWASYQVIQQQYHSILSRYFNCAVHENALKWSHTERPRGRLNYDDADRMLAFCEQHDIPVRGHTLFWAVPKYTGGWRKELFANAPASETERMVMARAIGQTWLYQDRIDEWDLNNEMLHGRMYRDLLGEDIVKKMADWAHIGNPDAVLYLNDFSVLSGGAGDKYVEQIRSLLAQDVAIGGIGCQAHFWGPWVDVFHIRETLDKLAQFGLPIKATEFDYGNDPEQQRRGFTAFYRTLFAHPAVDGILMWGFWAGRHWRGDDAPWAKDFTPRPAAEEYIRLTTEEWHTQWHGQADENGQVVIPNAFYGLYEVQSGDSNRQVWHSKAAIPR